MFDSLDVFDIFHISDIYTYDTFSALSFFKPIFSIVPMSFRCFCGRRGEREEDGRKTAVVRGGAMNKEKARGWRWAEWGEGGQCVREREGACLIKNQSLQALVPRQFRSKKYSKQKRNGDSTTGAKYARHR